MRAFAAAWVLAFHLLPAAKVLFPSIAGHTRLIEGGYLGVDVFFVLSGFILAHAYAHTLTRLDPVELGQFLWLRLARVWPLHVAVTLGLLAAYLAAKATGFQTFSTSPLFRLETLPAHLGLVQSWGGTAPSWNIPSWSVSCEWLAYLSFPFLSLAAGRVRRPGVLVGLALLAVALFVGYVELRRGGDMDLTYEGGTARIAAEFTVGVLLERATRLARLTAPDLVVAGALAVVVAAIQLDWIGPWLVLPIAVFVVGLGRNRGRVSRALSGPALEWMGERSYALYLVHGPVILFARGLWPVERLAARPAWVGVAWLVGVVAVTAVSSALAYALVESPARSLLRRIGPRRVPKPGAVAAPT